MAGSFSESYIPWDYGLEDLLLEVILNLFLDLLGELCAEVKHRQYYAQDLDIRIELLLNDIDRLDELSKTFESIILTLDRDNDLIYAVRALIVRRPRDGGQSMMM